jgi:hypothetical protein
MPGNIYPIYSKEAHWGWNTIVNVADTGFTLNGATNRVLVFTADANGGYVKKLRIKHLGANAATVLRVFINNGSDVTVATNSIFFDEISIGSSIVNQAAAMAIYEIPINEALPAGYKIYVTTGTAVTNGLAVTVIAGKY